MIHFLLGTYQESDHPRRCHSSADETQAHFFQVSIGALALLVVVNARITMLTLRQLKLVGLGVISEESPQHTRPMPGVGVAPTLFGLIRRKRIGAIVVVF